MLGQMGQMVGSAGNQMALQAGHGMQEAHSTGQQLMTMQAQNQAEARRGMAERHKINQDTTTKVNEMQRESYVMRMKSSQKLSTSIHRVLTS